MRRLAISSIRFYQISIGRILPRVCRFEPTCSTYAMQALTEYGLITGLRMAIVRLLRCHPWHPGGYDPVPDRTRMS